MNLTYRRINFQKDRTKRKPLDAWALNEQLHMGNNQNPNVKDLATLLVDVITRAKILQNMKGMCFCQLVERRIEVRHVRILWWTSNRSNFAVVGRKVSCFYHPKTLLIYLWARYNGYRISKNQKCLLYEQENLFPFHRWYTNRNKMNWRTQKHYALGLKLFD